MTRPGPGWVRLAVLLEASGVFSVRAAAGQPVHPLALAHEHAAALSTEVRYDQLGHPCIAPGDAPAVAAELARAVAAENAALDEAYAASARAADEA